MKAEHRKELEQNTLAKDAQLLVQGVKTGSILKSINYRILGVVLAVLIVGGIWWYAVRQSRESTSGQWATFSQARSASTLKEFIAGNQKDLAGQVARLEQARRWYGPEGLAQLQSIDPAKRKEGIENISKARDEFVKLVALFESDPTLRAASLLDAASAELSLVGIPESVGSDKDRGTVAKAVEHLRQAVKVVGEESEYGKQLKKRADTLEADSAKVVNIAKVLYNPLLPTTDPHGSGVSPLAPKGPLAPIPAPTNPADAPKAPATTTPPTVVPTPTTTPEPKKDPAPTPAPKAEPKKEATPEPKKEAAPETKPAPAPTPKAEPKKEAAPTPAPKAEPKKEATPTPAPKTDPAKK